MSEKGSDELNNCLELQERLDDPFRMYGALLCRDHEVFANREGREDATALGHEAHAKTGNPFGTEASDRLAVQPNLAFPGLQEPDDGGDTGRLAGTVAS